VAVAFVLRCGTLLHLLFCSCGGTGRGSGGGGVGMGGFTVCQSASIPGSVCEMHSACQTGVLAGVLQHVPPAKFRMLPSQAVLP